MGWGEEHQPSPSESMVRNSERLRRDAALRRQVRMFIKEPTTGNRELMDVLCKAAEEVAHGGAHLHAVR